MRSEDAVRIDLRSLGRVEHVTDGATSISDTHAWTFVSAWDSVGSVRGMPTHFRKTPILP